MQGIIKKDLFMIKNNLKAIIVSLIIYGFYSIMFDMDMSFLLPLMTLMISISTFNYDDFNNWHTYAATLPKGKENVVKSKYLTTIGIITLAVIISIFLSFIINNIRSNIEIDISVVIGEIFAIVFMMSILFPILFKYGSEKGRIAMMLIGICIFGIIFLVTKVIKIEISHNIISFWNSYFGIIFFIVSIIMLFISYLISKKIYLKKEF